jgi:hypothetical protein
MTFLQIYNRTLRLLEYDPATWGGSAGQQETVAEALSWRCRVAWEKTMWSRLVRLESMAVSTDSDGAFYVSYGSGVGRLVAVWNVYARNPRSHKSPKRLNFLLSRRGVELDGVMAETVWVEFRPKPPQFTRVAWTALGAYAEGDVVYDAASGECYRSLDNVNTGHAVSDTDWWEKQEVPDFLAEYLARAAFADLLRNDGRGERADIEEGRAEFELERVLNVEETQQDQHRKINASIP